MTPANVLASSLREQFGEINTIHTWIMILENEGSARETKKTETEQQQESK